MTKMILDYRGYRLEYEVRGNEEKVAILKDGREVMTAQNVGRAKEWVRAQTPTVLGLHVIQYPNGRFGFVGVVPRELVITKADGSPLSDAEFREYKYASNPALVKKMCGYKVHVYHTREEAVEHATRLGYSVVES